MSPVVEVATYTAYAVGGVVGVGSVFYLWTERPRAEARRKRQAERDDEAVARWLKGHTDTVTVFRGTDKHGRRVAR